MTHHTVLNIIMIFSLSFFVSDCSSSSDDENQEETASILLATSESSFVKFFSYTKDGKIESVITGYRGILFQESRDMSLTQFRMLRHIDNDTNPSSDKKNKYIELKADFGRFNFNNLNFEAWGNVVVVRNMDIRVEADRLFWDEKNKRLFSREMTQVKIYKLVDKKDEKNEKGHNVVRVIGENMVVDQSLEMVELDRSLGATQEDMFTGGI